MRKIKSLIGIIIATTMIFTACSKAKEQEKSVHDRQNEVVREIEPENDLALHRADFKTTLITEGPAPQGYRDTTPPEGVKEVSYKSGELDLKGWLSEVKEDGEKYPAVVYVHGGLAFGEGDWNYAEQYLQDGFVVFAPTLRGENGNPGNFEFFYGEVDDVIAAGEYLAELPYIDKEKIYVVGHSTGGTLTMLTAMMPSPFKGAASFGGSPEQKYFFKHFEEIVPFDMSNEEEIALRSPMEYVHSLRIPLTVYVGKNDLAYRSRSNRLAKLAQDNDKDCECVIIEGDHFTSLEESVSQSIKKFKED